MKAPSGITLALVGLALLSMLGGQTGGCNLPVIGSQPLFAAEDGKPCVYVSADLSATGNAALGKSHPGVLTAIVNWCVANNGEYRWDDTNATNPPGDGEDQWVRDAWKVADRSHPPSIVAASKSRGVGPRPLPSKPADATALLDGIKP